MAGYSKTLEHQLLTIYDRNPYVKLLDMRVNRLGEGTAELVMPVIAGKHTNLYEMAHGGALASMADTAMGVACATLGKRVVTLEMNMNFIRNAVPQAEIKAISRMIHNGKTTMVVASEIIDSSEQLIATARATFFVVGRFEE